MTIKTTTQDNRTTIALEGMLDSTSAAQFQEAVEEQLAKEPIDIIMDMSGLTYTSSQGLRIILTLIKRVMSAQGKLVFRNIRPAVREVLDMAGISQAMTIE